MLRITKTTKEGKTLLRLEGRVVQQWTQELDRVCQSESSPIILDLSGVTFADRKGAALIRQFRAEGTELLGASLLLSELIDGPKL